MSADKNRPTEEKKETLSDSELSGTTSCNVPERISDKEVRFFEVNHNKPIMLLDIDGVINAVTPGLEDKHPAWEKKDFDNATAGNFQVIWSKKVIDQLCAWKQSERIDIRWLTSWGLRANKIFAPVVGLPRLKNGFDAEPLKKVKGSRPSKTLSFIAFYEAHLVNDNQKKNKLIWIDDEVIYHLEDVVKTLFEGDKSVDSPDTEVKKLEERIEFFKTNPNLLLIQPEPKVGLVPTHFEMINDFIEDRLSNEEMFAYHQSLKRVDNSCVIC
jgi:hypothetical protein